MEPYVRGACMGDFDSQNPTAFDKLQAALEDGPSSKDGTPSALMGLVGKCGGVGGCDTEGATPLRWAARYSHTSEFVQLLLSKGANVEGLTTKQIKANITGTTDPTPLHEAARYDHSEVAKVLLTIGKSNPNPQDEDGVTPLHIAALWNHTNIAAVLLAHEADRTIKNHGGETPADWATNQAMKDLLIA